MKKIDFQTLLTDFFLLFNPSKVSEVNYLVEKYTGQELDAIQMCYIKYNQKSHVYYNPNVTEEFLLSLIESYKSKERVLSKENFEKIQNEKIAADLEKQAEEEIAKKQEVVDLYKDFEISINNLYNKSEVSLPDSKILLNMGVGSKIICRNNDKKIIALHIQDITMDFVTDINNPKIEITIGDAL